MSHFSFLFIWIVYLCAVKKVIESLETIVPCLPVPLKKQKFLGVNKVTETVCFKNTPELSNKISTTFLKHRLFKFHSLPASGIVTIGIILVTKFRVFGS